MRRAILAVVLVVTFALATHPPGLGADDAAAPAAGSDAQAPAVPAASAAPDAAAVESPVTVRARLEPDTTTIGTPFRYTMEITAPTGMQIVLAQPTERLGVFDILDFGEVPPLTHAGATTITRWFQLTGWEPGHHELESPPVQWRAGDAALTAAPGTKVIMTIDSTLAKAGAPTDIRDVKPPQEPPFYWRPYYVAAAVAAVLLATVLGAFALLRRRGRARVAPPPRPPHEIAVEELERLRGRRLTDSGLFKEYYSALTDIVRRYLEGRFALRAPEMTTEEFLLATARGGRLQSAHRALLGEFLSESDLVKFARHVPTIADSERAWTAAHRFVAETAEAAGDDAGSSRAGSGGRRRGRGPTRRAGETGYERVAHEGGADAPR